MSSLDDQLLFWRSPKLETSHLTIKITAIRWYFVPKSWLSEVLAVTRQIHQRTQQKPHSFLLILVKVSKLFPTPYPPHLTPCLTFNLLVTPLADEDSSEQF